jgi:hypothetical protein
MLPSVRNPTGFDLRPLGDRQSGQSCDLLKGTTVRYAGLPDQLAKDMTGCLAAQGSGAGIAGG